MQDVLPRSGDRLCCICIGRGIADRQSAPILSAGVAARTGCDRGRLVSAAMLKEEKA